MLGFGGAFRKIKVINELSQKNEFLNAGAITRHNDTLWVSTRTKHYLHEQRSFVDLFDLRRGK